jgi:DNA-binding NtrC family response regulator
VVSLEIPPLRNRKEDIELLTTYLLNRISAELGVVNPGIIPTALSQLHQYDWPGNIRELANKLKRALIFNQGAPLSAGEILLSSSTSLTAGLDPPSPSTALREMIRQVVRGEPRENLFESFLDQASELLVDEALQATAGNRTKAARLLGISRPTLHARIDRYNLKTSPEDNN